MIKTQDVIKNLKLNSIEDLLIKKICTNQLKIVLMNSANQLVVVLQVKFTIWECNAIQYLRMN